MCDPRIQLPVALRTKCDGCSPDIRRFRRNIQGDHARKDDSETGKRHLPDGRDDGLHEDKQIANKKEELMHYHAFIRSAQLFAVRGNGMYLTLTSYNGASSSTTLGLLLPFLVTGEVGPLRA